MHPTGALPSGSERERRAQAHALDDLHCRRSPSPIAQGPAFAPNTSPKGGGGR